MTANDTVVHVVPPNTSPEVRQWLVGLIVDQFAVFRDNPDQIHRVQDAIKLIKLTAEIGGFDPTDIHQEAIAQELNREY